jgi:hypothetical protein
MICADLLNVRAEGSKVLADRVIGIVAALDGTSYFGIGPLIVLKCGGRLAAGMRA